MHGSAARRAEVAYQAMMSVTEGKSCSEGRQCKAPSEKQRLIMFVREIAYHIVASR